MLKAHQVTKENRNSRRQRKKWKKSMGKKNVQQQKQI
jgi:hypothetical protein